MKITNQKTIAPERSSGPIGLTETDPGDSTYQEPIIVAVYGDEGTGKSTIIGTAPGKIGVIPLERKTRASVLKAAAENDKTVVMPDIDLIRTGNPMLIANLDPACIVEEKNGNTAARAAKLMQEKSREIGLDVRRRTCLPFCS